MTDIEELREETFFYVYDRDGMRVAWGSCPNYAQADREATHYAMMYNSGGEGPVRIRLRRAARARVAT